MRRTISPASVPLVLAALLVVPAPTWAGLGFRVIPVDTLGNVGVMPSLAVDASGRAHVSYGDGTAGALKYAAEGADLAWTAEVVDGSVSVVDPGGLIASSLRVDASGTPSVAYNSASGDLLFARKEGGAWAIETADAGGSTRGVVSLALDAQGNPAVSFHEADAGVLRFARRGGGGWSVETVDAEAGAGAFSSLAFDAAGAPHIAYFFSAGPGDGRLRYAARRGAAWTIETLADPPGWDAGWAPSIVVDGAGVPHIAYWASGEGALGYVVKAGATWVHDVVDGPAFGADAAVPGRLTIEASGAPSIAYFVAPARDVRYAWKSSSGWRRQTFASDGELGLYPSHVPGSAASGPRIALYDEGRGDLLFGSSEIAVTGPRGGEVWLSATDQVVTWAGRGPVDIDLSLDGGLSFTPLASGAGASPTRVAVPDVQTKAAKVRVRAPGSSGAALSDSVFSILEVALQADLLAWLSPKSSGGVHLAWPVPAVGPGPKGFRLERIYPEPTSQWTIVTSRGADATEEEKPEHFDAQGRLGARYRLLRVDDLGNEFLVGETGVLEKKPAR